MAMIPSDKQSLMVLRVCFLAEHTAANFLAHYTLRGTEHETSYCDYTTLRIHGERVQF